MGLTLGVLAAVIIRRDKDGPGSPGGTRATCPRSQRQLARGRELAH